jgi:CRISPR-associated endonuclease Cas1
MAFDAVEGDDLEWAARCEYWAEKSDNDKSPRGRRERNAQPLILTGHAVSMRVDNGSLIIRDGVTHFPQERRTFRFFRGDLNLPTRILLLNGSGSLSFDVLSWLAEQGVALARITWRGDIVTVAGAGFAAERDKVRWQVETRADPERRLRFSTELIRRKAQASIAALETLIPPSNARAKAIALAQATDRSLAERLPKDLVRLRLMEAKCASAYFAAWRGLTLDWRAERRRPVPEDWRAFVSRSSLANGRKLLNVNASHPLNAMLNYGYAVLQAQLQINAVADGYDPTEGVMHHGRRGKPAFIFDLMEPERPKVDATILQFVAEQSFSGADFPISANGICRLSPSLARRVAQLVSLRAVP